MTDDTIHTCSYSCERPGCIRAQRDYLAARLTAETSNARGKVEYEYEVWQGAVLQAGGRENDYASAQSEASHYAMMYVPDGPVEVRIYEKRLLSAAKVRPKRRRYNPSGSLSEYGIFPECDAQPLEAATPPSQESAMDKPLPEAVVGAADDEVVFIDGVGAARSSVKSCRDGVQWIKVGDRVYWPLSDSDAKRLQSACCGKGSFDGPTTPADDALLDWEAKQPAPQQSAAVVDEAAVRRVIAELRAYNPAADEYKGAHIHKVWARELTSALAAQHQEPTT